MPLLVVHGAKTACTGCPGGQSQLRDPSPSGVSATQACLNAAAITDHVPIVNIVPFPGCVFKSGDPCVPVTPAPWTGAITSPPFFSLSPVLTDAHVLVCANGGLISIADPGQHVVDVGDIVQPEDEDEDEGFWSSLWDDGWLLADVGIAALDFVTIPSGEGVAGIAARRAARQALKNRAKAAASRPKPSWTTSRRRYWKQRAREDPDEFSPEDLERMRKGAAPRHPDYDVPKELHHIKPRREGGSDDPDNLLEVWPWEHDAIDPFRHYRGPRPND